MWGSGSRFVLCSLALLVNAICFANTKDLIITVQGQSIKAERARFVVIYNTLKGKETEVSAEKCSEAGVECEEHSKYLLVSKENLSELPQDKSKYYLSTAQITEAQNIRFANDNELRVLGSLSFYPRSDVISLIEMAIANTTIWKNPKGESITLNCGKKLDADNLTDPEAGRPRLISFYENQQLYRGCSVVSTSSIESTGSEIIKVNAMSGDIDFAKDGRLLYVQSGSSDDFHILGQAVKLAENREISFYENGLPHFFTVAPENVFVYESIYGPMQFTTAPQILTSVTMTDTGAPEKGYLKNVVSVEANNFSKITIGQGRILLDSATHKIDTAELFGQQEISLQAAGLNLWIDGVIQLYTDEELKSKYNLPPKTAVKTLNLAAEQVVKIGSRELPLKGGIGFFPNQTPAVVVTSKTIDLNIGQESFKIEGKIMFDINGVLRLAQLAQDYDFNFEPGKVAKINKGEALIFDNDGKVISFRPEGQF